MSVTSTEGHTNFGDFVLVGLVLLEFKRIPGMPSEFWEYLHSLALEAHRWRICAEGLMQTVLHLSYLLEAYSIARLQTGLEDSFCRRPSRGSLGPSPGS